MHDIEDFFIEEKAARLAADGNVSSEQAALKPGDYCLREAHGLTVISEILDPITHLLAGRAMGDLEDEEREEVEDTRATYNSLVNYRFTRSYSEACPQGELGDVHVSVVTPITKDRFDQLKAKLL